MPKKGRKKATAVLPVAPVAKKKTIEDLEAELSAMAHEDIQLQEAMAALKDSAEGSDLLQPTASKDDATPHAQDTQDLVACALGAYAAQDSDVYSADEEGPLIPGTDEDVKVAMTVRSRRSPLTRQTRRIIQGYTEKDSCTDTVMPRPPVLKGSAMQGKPKGGTDAAIPPQHQVIRQSDIDYYSKIPIRKQQDCIELAIIQVMQDHGLHSFPKDKAYRSMFDELVIIKMKKLYDSRVNRMKRRVNRKKQ